MCICQYIQLFGPFETESVPFYTRLQCNFKYSQFFTSAFHKISNRDFRKKMALEILGERAASKCVHLLAGLTLLSVL